MAEFNISTIDKKQPHLYLAWMQGTQKAILPVHTPAKHNLFWDLMKSNPIFNTQSSGPMWKLAVKVWNKFADKESGIFYKVCLLHQGKPQLHISPNNWNIWWNYFEFPWIKSNYCSEQITSNYPILIRFLTLTWGYFRVTLKLLISVYKLLASDTKLHCG